MPASLYNYHVKIVPVCLISLRHLCNVRLNLIGWHVVSCPVIGCGVYRRGLFQVTPYSCHTWLGRGGLLCSWRTGLGGLLSYWWPARHVCSCIAIKQGRAALACCVREEWRLKSMGGKTRWLTGCSVWREGAWGHLVYASHCLVMFPLSTKLTVFLL